MVVKEYQTYGGKEITPQSILNLQPQPSAALQKAVESWMEKYKEVLDTIVPLAKDIVTDDQPINKSDMERLIVRTVDLYKHTPQIYEELSKDELAKLTSALYKRRSLPALSPIDLGHELQKKYIQDAGFKDASAWNFAIPQEFAGEEYYAKGALPFNRIYTMFHSNPNPEKPGEFYGYHTPDKLTNDIERVETFQTISQLAYYLRGLETQQKMGLQDLFILPRTYLFHIPGRNMNGSYDSNSLLVQESLPDMVSFRADPARISKLSDDVITAAFLMIKAIAGWDIKTNLLIHKDKDVLSVVDFEQPNSENARDFFQKNPQKRMGNILAGMEGFADILREAKAAAQAEAFKKLVQEDAELKNVVPNIIERLEPKKE